MCSSVCFFLLKFDIHKCIYIVFSLEREREREPERERERGRRGGGRPIRSDTIVKYKELRR